jgi:hypothetical protein
MGTVLRRALWRISSLGARQRGLFFCRLSAYVTHDKMLNFSELEPHTALLCLKSDSSFPPRQLTARTAMT